MYQSLPRTKRSVAKLLLLCSIFHLCLGISGQSTGRVTPKITLSAKNVTITDVFKAIKSQTGKIVWFMNEEVNADKKVTVNFENATLDEVMKTLFGAASDFTWSFDNEKVILRKKKQGEDNVITSGVEPSSVRVDSVPNTITVTGKVTDEKGSPIIGATVVVKGTRVGTTTGVDGGFVLEGVKPRAMLTVSNIGYLTSDMPLINKTTLHVILKEYVEGLDETVVIAYGTSSKRILTGNIATVKAKDIEIQPISNPLLALQGRVTGMIVTQQTGLAGGSIKVQIRGQNSLLNGNEPLYVVDGVPISSTVGGLSNILGQNPSAFHYMNSTDIESIDILKDADATAIYGSRGANGVILITTKKGKSGPMKLDINLSTGWSDVARKIDYLNTTQYLEMRREAFRNDAVVPDQYNAPDLFVWDTLRYTDWQQAMIGNKAQYTEAISSISGGNDNISYLIGGNYHKETTVFPGSFSDQKSGVHFNINGKSQNGKFSSSLSGNYLSDRNFLPGFDFTQNISLAPNTPPPYNKDGSLNWENSTWDNPYRFLNVTYKSKIDNLVSQAIFSYQLFSNLELKLSMGYNDLNGKTLTATPLTSYDPAFWSFRQRSSVVSNTSTKSFIIEPQLNYKIRIKGGDLSTLIGASIQQNDNEIQVLNAFGFNSDDLLENTLAAANISANTTKSQYKYNAIFTRINYNWQDKYFFNLTARRDGSSRFGPGKQFANFGAIGVGWIFTNEGFIKNNISFLSFGKLRFSYGTTGNDQIGDYQFLDRYSSTSGNYQNTKGLLPVGLFNTDFAWEINRKMELGLESGFLKDRILFSISGFRNRSSNQLVGSSLPTLTGFSSIISNLPATVQNLGLEFTLSTINIRTKKINWSSTFNLTVERNKLISYFNLENSPYASTYVIGQPISIIKAFNSVGVDKQSGQYLFSDNKGVAVTTPDFISDVTALINRTPKYYGGFQNSFSFKGLQLDFLFQFVKQIGISYPYNFIPGTININQPVSVLKRWKKPGDVTNIQRFNQDYSLYDSYNNVRNSNESYSNASFIRLKNLSISFQLPETLRDRLHLKNLRFYIQAQNIFTITNYVGLDPEAQSAVGLPPLRVITTGVQITL